MFFDGVQVGGKMGAKYQDIIKWLKNQIDEGHILPGSKVPSEHSLSAQFHVTRQTVRHAINVLEEEGLIYRIQGSGTYVQADIYDQIEGRNSVAFITTYVDGYIFPRIIQGIEKRLSEYGYSVQIAFTNNRFDREKAVLEDFLNREEIAGVIAEPTKSSLPNPNLELYKAFQKRHIPVLFINSFYPELDLPHVSINDTVAGRMAATYLLERGHRKIGGIFKLDDGQGRLRYAGMVEAMRKMQVPVEDNYFYWIDTADIHAFAQNREKLLWRFQDCTGIVCYNDEVAYAVKEILQKAGLRIPDDVSIVSIDNSELSMLSDVPFTSVNHPKDILGEKAADNLIAILQRRITDATFEFTPSIVERDSVKEI